MYTIRFHFTMHLHSTSYIYIYVCTYLRPQLNRLPECSLAIQESKSFGRRCELPRGRSCSRDWVVQGTRLPRNLSCPELLLQNVCAQKPHFVIKPSTMAQTSFMPFCLNLDRVPSFNLPHMEIAAIFKDAVHFL